MVLTSEYDERMGESKREQKRYHVRASRLEHFMCYMWTGKDIGWYFASAHIAYPFAFLAMVICLSLLFHSVWNKYFASSLNHFCVALWLLGNFMWMLPEVTLDDTETLLHDHERHQLCDYYAQVAFIASICLILLQMLVFGPLNFITDPVESSEVESSYFESLGLVPSFVPHELVIGYGSGPCHAQITLDWQTYEHLHFLWWVLKDLSWVTNCVPLWFVSVFFTVCIAADFIITSSFAGQTFEALHYLGTAMWLLGNIVWSFGEFFDIGQDRAPNNLFNTREIHTCRYWAAILVILSIVPYICAYCFECRRDRYNDSTTNKTTKTNLHSTTSGLDTMDIAGTNSTSTARPRLRSSAGNAANADEDQQALLLPD